MEWPIEIGKHISPFFEALCNLVKFLFYLSSKMIIYDSFEMLYQEIIHQNTDICVEHHIVLRPGYFSFRLCSHLPAISDKSSICSFLSITIFFDNTSTLQIS